MHVRPLRTASIIYKQDLHLEHSAAGNSGVVRAVQIAGVAFFLEGPVEGVMSSAITSIMLAF